MRFKVVLSRTLRSNYVALPADTHLRQSLPNAGSALCQALKVSLLTTQGASIYLGFTGAQSAAPRTIELSRELGLLLQIEEDSLVEVQLEYSFQKLASLELEPLTVDDFEVVEQNAGQVEEQLLNQVGVFYQNQVFCLFLGNNGQSIVRLRSVMGGQQASQAACFFLTDQSELHIQAKIRKRPLAKHQAIEPEPIAPEPEI